MNLWQVVIPFVYCFLLYDMIKFQSGQKIVFSKCDLPQSPFPVIKICKGSILVGTFADLFLTNALAHR